MNDIAELRQPGPICMERPHLPFRSAAALVLGLWLAGCSAGPDFKRPDSPAIKTYVTGPAVQETVSAPVELGGRQRLATGLPDDPQWWRRLGSHRLDVLIEQALQTSPTLAEAQARLRQAEELLAARSGATRLPQVDMQAGAQRLRMSPSTQGLAGDPRTFGLYNAGIGIHYSPDLSGGNRRALEGLAARADYSRYQLEAARQNLIGNIANAAITRARLAAQLETTSTILNAQTDLIRLAGERVRLGQAAADEVLALQTQAEQTRSELPALRKQMQQTEHLLAVLAGQSPGTGTIPDFTLSEFVLPAELPLVVPSELVHRRPDIQAAESLLQAANADYGVAVSRLYPQINLSATLGSQALSPDTLFSGSSMIWSLVGQLTQPLFNPGLPAEKRAALAAFDAAAANYRGVVLDAFRNVADTLRAVENDAQTLQALANADSTSRAALRAVETRYKLGASSYEQVIIAEQQAERTRLVLSAAQAQRLLDSVDMSMAVGSGTSAP